MIERRGEWPTWLMVVTAGGTFLCGLFVAWARPIAAVEPAKNLPMKTRHLAIVDEDGRTVMTLSGAAGHPLIEFLRPESPDAVRMTIESGGALSREETWLTFLKNRKPQAALTAKGMLYFDGDGKPLKK